MKLTTKIKYPSHWGLIYLFSKEICVVNIWVTDIKWGSLIKQTTRYGSGWFCAISKMHNFIYLNFFIYDDFYIKECKLYIHNLPAVSSIILLDVPLSGSHVD